MQSSHMPCARHGTLIDFIQKGLGAVELCAHSAPESIDQSIRRERTPACIAHSAACSVACVLPSVSCKPLSALLPGASAALAATNTPPADWLTVTCTAMADLSSRSDELAARAQSCAGGMTSSGTSNIAAEPSSLLPLGHRLSAPAALTGLLSCVASAQGLLSMWNAFGRSAAAMSPGACAAT